MKCIKIIVSISAIVISYCYGRYSEYYSEEAVYNREAAEFRRQVILSYKDSIIFIPITNNEFKYLKK